ncbi:MAG: hypothetical protein BroJett040_13910 [Oligoflexia bacterium]|nr:MAG: hypothetical protein BroJett040_13910 [Oligoflexia bacterium]
MKTMNALKTVLATATLVSTLSAQAADTTLPPWLDVSGNISFDGTSRKTDSGDWDKDFRVQDAELRFEILAREGMKLVIKAELERVLNRYINDEDLDTKLGEMLEEAYIQIETDKVLGLPRAVITLGKHRMAFGQRIAELPMFKDSLLYKLNNEEEMIGFTVALPASFFKIADEVAFSLYETGAGDMKISKDKAVSVQLSKQLTNQIKMQISALMKQHEGKENETRGSLGFVYTSADGKYKVWAEGIVMEHNPEFLDSRYGATLGAAMKLGKGAIVVEGSVLEKVAKEIALAYNLPVGSHLVLSPEVRYVMKEDGTRDTVLGIRARIAFGKQNARVAKPH